MNLLLVLIEFIFRIVHHSLFVNSCAAYWRILPLFWAKSRYLKMVNLVKLVKGVNIFHHFHQSHDFCRRVGGV